MSRRHASLFALLLLIASAGVALGRLSPRTDERESPVSLSNLNRHVKEVAREPHPVQSEANQRVRDYILAELRAFGLDPQVQSGRITSVRGREFVVHNIVCVVPSQNASRSGPAALLVCHYDSHPRAPGAGDDGNAVACMLETARLLAASGPPVRDIVLLFTDGEEYGLLGAQVWLRDNPDFMGCRVLANFEARGTSGPAVMFETAGAPVDLFHSGYARRSPHPVTSSLASPVYERMPNTTDFTVFKRAGFSGLNFAFIGGVENYHAPRDDPAHLSGASLLHQGQQMYEIARYFATRPHEQFAQNIGQRELDLVYFDVLSLVVVSWPAALAGPLALVAAVIAGAGIWRLRPRRALVGAAMLRLLACVLLVVAWVHAFSLGLIEQADMRFLPLAFAAAAALAMAAMPFAAARGRRRERAMSATVLAALALGTVATGMSFAPGSYVLLIPTVALGTAACAPVRWRPAAMAMAAAISTVVLLPLAWLVAQALTIRLLAAPAVLLVMLTWLWRPSLAPLLGARWKIAASFGLLAAGGFVIVIAR